MLQTIVKEAGLLGEDSRREMYSLFARYYDATTYDRFVGDLSAKDFVLLLFDERSKLRGFSTLEISRTCVLGHEIQVAFSGDTIIEREFWGSQALAFAWLRHIGHESAAAPDLPMLWLLTVKGHRTYRYLPTFGLRFTPDWRRPDQPRLTAMRDALAAGQFGSAYNPATGLVKFPSPRGHLALEWAVPSERERARPDVRYFLEKNPGYAQGDELVCLCHLSEDNMWPLTRRVYRQGFKGRKLEGFEGESLGGTDRRGAAPDRKIAKGL